MNWLRKLLRKPAPSPVPEKPAAKPTPPAPPVPTDADFDRLRLAVAATNDAQERERRERELGRALAAAGRAPDAGDAPTVLAEAVCHAGDKAQALAALGRLEAESALAQVAIEARYAEVRYAAARRVADPAALERIAEASRDKDKRVYRQASEALRQLREAAERTRSIARIEAALRELLANAPIAGARFVELEKEARNLGDAGEELAECARLAGEVRARLQIETQAQRALQADLTAARALASELADPGWPYADRMEAWGARAAQLAQGCSRLPAWLAGSGALDETLAAIRLRLDALRTDAERAAACEALLERLPQDAPPDAAAGEAWEALPRPENDAARAMLEARWQACLRRAAPPPPREAPRELAQPATAELAAEAAADGEVEVLAPPPPKVEPRPVVDAQALQPLLEALEQALEEGHLADAEAADKKVEQLVGTATLPGAAARRLRGLRAQLARLRGWARWGTDQAREQLVAAAEELLANEPDLDERARAIPAMREEWKRLNAHGPSSKAAWERFDAALTTAYQPVADQRAREAAEHEATRAAKEALCAEWEAWLAGIVWEHVDYKVVEARRQEIIGQWRGTPAAGFRDERQLRKRFDAFVAALDARLDEARGREIARREALIAEVDKLKDDTDLQRAIGAAKAAQGRWRDEAATLRLTRGDEQALWQRFRAACDTVFARRDALKAEQEAQRERDQQSRRQLVEEFEAALAGNDAGAIDKTLAHVREAWPREERRGDAPDPRLREFAQRARDRVEALHREKRQGRFGLMANKAALAEQVEAAATEGRLDDAFLAQQDKAWSALPRLPGKSESPLAERYAKARLATGEALERGHELREAMLLDLEIALELPSPAPLAEERRARQLGTLQQRMSGGGSSQQEVEAEVVRWYATGASADGEHSARMAAIVERLLGQQGGR
jgi:hypothetical protein